jgi:hypothetical protein
LIACYAAGDAYCKGHYFDAASLKICNDSVTDSCGKSWGPASTCMTDKIVAGGAAGLPPTVVAPSVNAAPLAPNQQLQLLQQQQLRRRGYRARVTCCAAIRRTSPGAEVEWERSEKGNMPSYF